MKTNILSFALGAVCVLFIAATTDTFQIVQPKKPTITEVKSFRSMFGMESEVESYINSKIRQGYIVKSVSMMDDDSWSKGIVVVEKY